MSRAEVIGAKIVSARKRRGLSQAQLSDILAERLNRSPETIRRSLTNWERGRNEPRGYALEALAEATGQPLDFFTDNARRERQESGDDDSEAASMALALLDQLVALVAMRAVA